MFDGPLLLVALALSILFVVVTTTRYKLHPFLALILAAYGMGLAGGLGPQSTLTTLTDGFGKTLGYIGIVIACGCMIGTVLEKSGCALVMAHAVLRLIGKTRAILAMSGTGAIVSIPVFCDSGYVILSPLNRSLARQTGQSLAGFAVALGMGLYATHCLVPPTPGPIAVAGELRADLGIVILLGLVVVVPVVATTYWYARYMGRRIYIDPGPAVPEPAPAAAPKASYGAGAAFAPILLPALLIGLKSLADMPNRPLGDGSLRAGLNFLGDPNTALVLGVFLTWYIVRDCGREAFGNWCGEALRDAGNIILIIAAGGALGGILRATPLATLVGESMASLDLGWFTIVMPFLVASVLKIAIGSSTVAMITTASLVSPLLPTMGLAEGFGPALTTLAVASGSMIVTHVNDSYFWVITQMTGMTVSQGYRLVTVASAVAGFTAIAVVLGLGLILL